jgi:cytochrome b561
MATPNSARRQAPFQGAVPGYDAVTRAIHWLAAFVIVSAILLGLSMTSMRPVDEAAAGEIVRLYAVHKAVGLLSLGVAVLRVVWALTRARRPGPLHPDRKIETLAAAAVHWSLYGAMFVMPLSGWLTHAASPPYAAIPWPFGQGLPGIPEDPRLAALFGAVHALSSKVLFVAVALHMAGAFKHAIVDMDATMSRMTSGVGPAVARPRSEVLPVVIAAAVWCLAVGTAVMTAPVPEPDPFAEIGIDADAPAGTSAP